jgi:hypothetical protein
LCPEVGTVVVDPPFGAVVDVLGIVLVSPPTVVEVPGCVVVVLVPHVTSSVACTFWAPSRFQLTSTSTVAVAPASVLVAELTSSFASVVEAVTSTSVVIAAWPSTPAEIWTITPASGKSAKCTVTYVQSAVMLVTSCADATPVNPTA